MYAGKTYSSKASSSRFAAFYHNSRYCNPCPLCSVAPPGPINPGQYRPHDLHYATQFDPNLSLPRKTHLKAENKIMVSPATCDLLSGVDYNRHALTSTHRLEVDFSQPHAESTVPDEVNGVAVTAIMIV